jgi:hypothetical protein
MQIKTSKTIMAAILALAVTATLLTVGGGGKTPLPLISHGMVQIHPVPTATRKPSTAAHGSAAAN